MNFSAVQIFFISPWNSLFSLGSTLDSCALFCTATLAIIVAYRAGLFNLGAEGQIYAGAVAAAALLLAFDSGISPVLAAGVSVLAAFAAMFTGAALGAFAGAAKRYCGANELITTFLLSAAVVPFADFIAAGPLRDTTGNLLASAKIAPPFLLPRFFVTSPFSISAVIAILLLLCYSIFIAKTKAGFRFRISGIDANFARFGGIENKDYWIGALACSGALCGLTGYFLVAGTFGICYQGISGGLGWSAIAIAMIAVKFSGTQCRAEFFYIFISALLFTQLKTGLDTVTLLSGVNIENASLLQACIMFIFAANINFTRRRKNRSEKNVAN
jgi:simple sugar transport system permease protein